MTREASIIEFGSWLETPPGRYLSDWELARFDAELANIFGFHALQVGLPELDALRSNRMPHRWVAHHVPDSSAPVLREDALGLAAKESGTLRLTWDLQCRPEALPFPSDSLDLVVLPHTLELAQDPHQTLAEVARVLRPEGKVAISGLNPMSLWGLRHCIGRWRWPRSGAHVSPFLPQIDEFLGYWRLRDWLRLLGLELETAQLGCYRPPHSSAAWLQRCGWIESAGAKSWPVLGAVYFLVATKRVHGMRLLGLSRTTRNLAHAPPVAVASRRTD